MTNEDKTFAALKKIIRLSDELDNVGSLGDEEYATESNRISEELHEADKELNAASDNMGMEMGQDPDELKISVFYMWGTLEIEYKLKDLIVLRAMSQEMIGKLTFTHNMEVELKELGVETVIERYVCTTDNSEVTLCNQIKL